MNQTPVRIPLPGIVNKDTGPGDVIKRMTDALGIRLDNCQCAERQKKLNSWLVFTSKGQQK